MNIKTLIQTYNDKDPNYQGDLANHLNMALYALHQLGTTEEGLKSFAEHYITEMSLTPMKAPEMIITTENYRSYFGQKRTYSAFVVFYKNMIETSSKEAVLKDQVPLFIEGFSGDAFHGLIRLAYAVLLDDEDELAKALAYMAQCYLPFQYKQPLETTDNPKEQLVRLSKIKAFQTFKFQRSLIAGRMIDIYEEPLFHESVKGLDDSLLTYDQVISLIIEIYGRTLDFTMLHGLTSTHALLILKPYFKDIKTVLQHHFYHLQLAYLSTSCTAIGDLPTCEQPPSWEEIFLATTKSTDPHTIKVVYSMYQLSSLVDNDHDLRVLSGLKVSLIEA